MEPADMIRQILLDKNLKDNWEQNGEIVNSIT